MRYSAKHKLETRARILDAAGRIFRTEGYGGSGIDGLTKAAGVTNGAFYGHFRTKSEAFRLAVVAGLEELREGVAGLRAAQPKRWLRAFVRYYLGHKRTCELGEACALPSLSPDVMRADAETQSAYTEKLVRVIEEMAAGLSDEGSAREEARRREDRAIALLALLSGGVVMARAVSDPALSDRIARVVERAALASERPA
jgi:AcrR family transcriptional regulator